MSGHGIFRKNRVRNGRVPRATPPFLARPQTLVLAAVHRIPADGPREMRYRGKGGTAADQGTMQRNRAPRSVRETIEEKSRTRPLFKSWPEIVRRVRGATDLRLFLDFDGTLVDFRSRPDQVSMDEEMRDALGKLAAHPIVHTTLISGRRRASLMEYVTLPGVQLFGLYGWEKNDASPSALRQILRVRVLLAELPHEAPGIYIEDKELTLAVHFREAAPPAARTARAWLRRLILRFPGLRIIRSSNVWEVVPRDIRGKGVAVRAILRGVPPPYLPIYVGDDLTDEPPFAVLREGITVLVGPLRRTKARYHLRDTNEVCLFLQRLEAELP